MTVALLEEVVNEFKNGVKKQALDGESGERG
jgi:hypothetical protein